MNEVRSN